MESRQDELYGEVSREFGAALERLARAYEFDPDKRRDLLQEIHIALWRSLAAFDGNCHIRTWVYRVAHNTAVTHVIRGRRHRTPLASLDEVELLTEPRGGDAEAETDRRLALDRLLELIQRLEPPDRQVILGYLEGMDAAAIGEISGLSAGNVATKIHRIKAILAHRFHHVGSAGEGGGQRHAK